MATKRNGLDVLLDEFGKLQRKYGLLRRLLDTGDHPLQIERYKIQLANVKRRLIIARREIHSYKQYIVNTTTPAIPSYMRPYTK